MTAIDYTATVTCWTCDAPRPCRCDDNDAWAAYLMGQQVRLCPPCEARDCADCHEGRCECAHVTEPPLPPVERSEA